MQHGNGSSTMATPALPDGRIQDDRLSPEPRSAPVYEFGPFQLDPANRLLTSSGAEVRLPGRAFDALLMLVQRAGEVIDKTSLTRVALGRELERFDRSIDVHVSRLRHKLAEASAQSPRIDSIRGAGYVLLANSGGQA